MNRDDMQKRTMRMALEVIKLTKLFPNCHEGKVISYQIIKSSTSTAANYRAAGRAKSTKDFISKLCIAEEECDETLFWLDFIIDAKLLSQQFCSPLSKEVSELLAIIVSSIKSAKRHLNT
jgi:four helix bundle protein